MRRKSFKIVIGSFTILNFARTFQERSQLNMNGVSVFVSPKIQAERSTGECSSVNIKLIDKHESCNANLFELRSLVPLKVKSQYARTSA